MTREIRRYSNRKLYDVSQSAYVSLAEVGEIVRGGDEISVREYTTQRDLTAQILAEVIFYEEKTHPRLSAEGLHSIVRNGFK